MPSICPRGVHTRETESFANNSMINLCPPVAVGVVVVVINDPNFTLNCKRSIGSVASGPLAVPVVAQCSGTVQTEELCCVCRRM